MTVTTILDAIGDKCDDNTEMAKKRYKKHIEEIKSVLEGLKKQKMIKKWDVYGMEHGQPHGFIVDPGDVVSSWMIENQDSQNSKVSGNE